MSIDPKHIDQNILVLYLLNELPLEDKPAVEAWIKESESNQSTFSKLEKTWTETGKIEPIPVVVNTDQAWNSFKSRIREENTIPDRQSKNDPKVITIRRSVFFVAVAAIIVIGALSIVFSDWFRQTSDPVPTVIESFAEVILDTLKDGSTFALNQDSKIVYVESEKEAERQVELDGEAFFAVESDSSKPFVIDAGLGSIRVLGTKFNVKAYAGTDLEVLVESGLVRKRLAER